MFLRTLYLLAILLNISNFVKADSNIVDILNQSHIPVINVIIGIYSVISLNLPKLYTEKK